MNPTVHALLDDVFGVLGARSARLRAAVMDYLRSEGDRLPGISNADRAIVARLLPGGYESSDSPELARALAVHRPGWSPADHLHARRNLHAELAALGPEGDELIIRFGRVLAALSGHDEGIPPFPNSVVCLIRDALWLRGPRWRPPAISADRLVRLIELEGVTGPDARVLVVQLLLDERLPLARSFWPHREAVPDAIEFLLELEHIVVGLFDVLDPDHVGLTLKLAEVDQRFARVAAPMLVRGVIDGEAWLRPRLLAVLRSSPLSSYRDGLEGELLKCTTARLPRAISIVEQLEDSVSGADILNRAREHSSGTARRRLMDAAISRLAEMTFAPLSFVPQEPAAGTAITDSPLSRTGMASLRSALENRRQRARSLAHRKSQNPDDRWIFERNIAESLRIADECDRLLTDIAPLALSLEGRGSLPFEEAVVDQPFVDRLADLTIAQKIRLVSRGGRVGWADLRSQCPLPGVTARDVLDFAVVAGLDAKSVGLSLVQFALASTPIHVVTAQALWTIMADYLPELDRALGLAANPDVLFGNPDRMLAAIEVFAAAPEPVPRYLPAVSALARARSERVRHAARDALDRYGISPPPDGSPGG